MQDIWLANLLNIFYERTLNVMNFHRFWCDAGWRCIAFETLAHNSNCNLRKKKKKDLLIILAAFLNHDHERSGPWRVIYIFFTSKILKKIMNPVYQYIVFLYICNSVVPIRFRLRGPVRLSISLALRQSVAHCASRATSGRMKKLKIKTFRRYG